MKILWRLVEIGFAGTFVLLALAAAAILCHAIALRTGSTKDLWDVLTAIGTVGATVVALWLGLRQEFSKRADALVRAQVLASHVAPRLVIAANEATALVNYLDWYNDFAKHDHNYLDKLKHVADAAAPGLESDQIALLTPLQNRCAFRLARASGQIDVLRAALENRLASGNRGRAADKEIAYWLSLAIAASEAINIARDECVNVSHAWAEVTDDERYAPVGDSELPF